MAECIAKSEVRNIAIRLGHIASGICPKAVEDVRDIWTTFDNQSSKMTGADYGESRTKDKLHTWSFGSKLAREVNLETAD